MSLNQKGCCIDLTSVISLRKEGLEYHEQLPGYLRDLSATHGQVVGLCFPGWFLVDFPGGLSALEECLQYLFNVNSLRVLLVQEVDPLPPLWENLRSLGISWGTCPVYLGKTLSGVHADMLKEAGFVNFRQLDTTVVRW